MAQTTVVRRKICWMRMTPVTAFAQASAINPPVSTVRMAASKNTPA